MSVFGLSGTVLARLVADPELDNPKGYVLCRARVAIDCGRYVPVLNQGEPVVDDGGVPRFQKVGGTIFRDITFWNRDAERFAGVARKGTLISVEVYETDDQWKADDGTNRSKPVLHPTQNWTVVAQPRAKRPAEEPDEVEASKVPEDEEVPF